MKKPIRHIRVDDGLWEAVTRAKGEGKTWHRFLSELYDAHLSSKKKGKP